MSTANKLTYLNTTKGKIKDAINLTNANILSEDTFRSYAEKLKLGLLDIINNGTDDLYDSFPKTTQTGTEIALNDTYEAPMEIGLNGNTHQDSYTGKNWFDNAYGQNMNVYTKKIVANNPLGSVDCYPINLLPNTQYTLTVNMSGYEKTAAWIAGMCFANGDVISLLQYSTMGNVTTTTFTTDSTGIVYVGHRYGFTYGETGRMDLFLQTTKIQIEQGSSATPYEKFVGGTPSPNPDYPQDVEVVTGDNSINICGKNMFDDSTNNNVWIFSDGSISTTSGSNVRKYACSYGDGYTLSGTFTSASSSGIILIAFYDNKGNMLSRYTAVNNTSLTLTKTAPQNTAFMYAGHYGVKPTTIQLEQGSTATPYEPYQSQTYPLNLGSLELCKIGDYKDYIYKENDKWYKHSEIGKVVLDGSENWGTESAYTGYYGFINSILLANLTNSSNAMNNRFFQRISQAHGDYEYLYIQSDNGVLHIQILPSRLSGSSANDFRTWLSTHNTIVYYVLETPTNTEITDTDLINQLEELEKAKSVDDKTFISQINEQLPFILDVSALSKN